MTDASHQADCHACKIVAGEILPPGGIVIEDPFWHVAHLGVPAFAPGMLALIAKRHVVLLADLTEDELQAAARLFGKLSKAIGAALKPERVHCTFFGEGLPHAHFALIPRYAHMPAGNPVASLTEVLSKKYAISDEAAVETVGALQKALDSQAA